MPVLRTAAEAVSGVEWGIKIEGLAAVAANDGTDRFEMVAADGAVAVDEFVYSVRFTNVTPQSVDGLRVTSAVPPSLRFVAGSAVGPGSVALFSVDGGLTFGSPSELVVVDNEQLRAAKADDYTHVRWVLVAPLEGGATGFVRFRAARR